MGLLREKKGVQRWLVLVLVLPPLLLLLLLLLMPPLTPVLPCWGLLLHQRQH
jgi:hypothetical protein